MLSGVKDINLLSVVALDVLSFDVKFEHDNKQKRLMKYMVSTDMN